MKTPQPDYDRDERELAAAAATGLGDAVASIIHRMGLDRVHRFLTKIDNCSGCNARREALNRLGNFIRQRLGSAGPGS